MYRVHLHTTGRDLYFFFLSFLVLLEECCLSFCSCLSVFKEDRSFILSCKNRLLFFLGHDFSFSKKSLFSPLLSFFPPSCPANPESRTVTILSRQ